MQVVPVQHILDFRENPMMQYLKTLSMSVYTQCRRQLAYTIMGRSLTGFGPASAAEQLLKGPTQEVSIRNEYKVSINNFYMAGM